MITFADLCDADHRHRSPLVRAFAADLRFTTAQLDALRDAHSEVAIVALPLESTVDTHLVPGNTVQAPDEEAFV